MILNSSYFDLRPAYNFVSPAHPVGRQPARQGFPTSYPTPPKCGPSYATDAYTVLRIFQRYQIVKFIQKFKTGVENWENCRFSQAFRAVLVILFSQQ